jgi:addiction module RelB/DinJ family antitoxin
MDNLASINIKMNSNIKKQFEDVLGEIGLSVSAAFNVFARQVISENALPFKPSGLSEKEKALRGAFAWREMSGIFAKEAREMGIYNQDDVNKFLRDFRKEEVEEMKKRGVK